MSKRSFHFVRSLTNTLFLLDAGSRSTTKSRHSLCCGLSFRKSRSVLPPLERFPSRIVQLRSSLRQRCLVREPALTNVPRYQGATYIYINHLSPFLTSHEGEIDAAMTNARASATKMGMDYLNRGLRQARAFLLGNLFVEPSADGTTSTGTETPAPDRPPVLAEPALMSGQQTTSAAAVSGLARFAGGLLRQYAPAAIAAGNVLLQPMNKTAASPSSSAAAAATTSAHAGPASAGQDSETRRRAARSRRQELEAELASLHDPDDAPLSSSASETESSSTTTKAGAGGGGGGVGSLSFVEIVEAEAREYAASRQAGGARKSGSWFGWSSSSGGGGVDSAKKDA
jgi:receptor expression-enhancing protein 1/2/3/4